MFKDYDKYLSTSLKVYILVLVIVFIMKIVGLDYFGIDLNNPVLIRIEKLFVNLYIRDIWYFFTLIIYVYITIAISCNYKKCIKYVLILSPIIYIMQWLKTIINFPILVLISDFGYIYILCLILYKILKKKDYKNMTKRFILYNLISMIIQFISLITRYKYNTNYEYGFIENFILNLDYLIMTILIFKIYFMKGDNKLCIYQTEVYSFSQKLTNLRKLPKRLQRNWHKFKQLQKVDKITFIIYFALTLLWNIFTVVVVLLVATLNDTFIECIFILTSFWLSKRSFGKAFHIKSMIQCFIVSNITYYILNRITTPLGISILIPIMLGVGLSYVTSKLAKKTYKPLYRGMTKELFEETILKIVDKDSLKYKICYDFYINKKSDLSLSMKYNYSVVGIRKIKSRINDKIKEL